MACELVSCGEEIVGDDMLVILEEGLPRIIFEIFLATFDTDSFAILVASS